MIYINLKPNSRLITGCFFVSLILGRALLFCPLVYMRLHTESKSGTCLLEPLSPVICPPPPSPAQSYLIPGHLALMRDYLKSVNMAPISSAVVLCTHEYQPWRRGFLWLSKYWPITNAAAMSTGEVQTRAYANTASLIASVTVHYADERGIKTKKQGWDLHQLCLMSATTREPQLEPAQI